MHIADCCEKRNEMDTEGHERVNFQRCESDVLNRQQINESMRMRSIEAICGAPYTKTSDLQ